MGTYGIIDFGSNTIRLCIYRVDKAAEKLAEKQGRKAITSKDITLLLNNKQMAGISAYVQDGILTTKGMKKAARIIREHLECASYFGCEDVAIFATAVLRNCINSKPARRTIEKMCGAPITVLTNEEEAHLGLVGARLSCSLANATMVDIGGGSTELSALTRGNEKIGISLPLGSLSSFSLYVKGILPTQREIKTIANTFNKLYGQEDQKLFAAKNLIGIGGAIRAAAKVYGDLFKEGKRQAVLLPSHLDEILASYSKDPADFMHRAAKTIPDRIHTFIPGCAIIHSVFEKTGAGKLTIAKHGVREGFLIERVL